MKTVLQELIESIQHSIDIQNELNLNATQITTLTNVKLVAEELLEKEKEQMVDFADWIVEQKWDKVMHQGIKDDGTPLCKTTLELYNQIYNQNK